MLTTYILSVGLRIEKRASVNTGCQSPVGYPYPAYRSRSVRRYTLVVLAHQRTARATKGDDVPSRLISDRKLSGRRSAQSAQQKRAIGTMSLPHPPMQV